MGFIYDAEHLGLWGGVWHWTNKSSPHPPPTQTSPALAPPPCTGPGLEMGRRALQHPSGPLNSHRAPQHAVPCFATSFLHHQALQTLQPSPSLGRQLHCSPAGSAWRPDFRNTAFPVAGKQEHEEWPVQG